MQEKHSKQSGFTYGLCEPFTKYREAIQNFIETGNLKDSYRKELEKACFVYDGAYSDSKDLAKRTVSNQVLKDKTYKS